MTVNNFIKNLIDFAVFEAEENFKNFGKINDKKIILFPIQVNAFYSAVSNAIMFPAAVLDIPFISQNFPQYDFSYIFIIFIFKHKLYKTPFLPFFKKLKNN